MSPRPRQSSLASSRTKPMRSRNNTLRGSRYHSPEHHNLSLGLPETADSGLMMASPMDASQTGNHIWDNDMARRFSDTTVGDYDSLVVDDFAVTSNFVMPMASMSDCLDTAPAGYSLLNHSGMSQTLTGPYQESMYDNDLMPSSSMNMNYPEYNHYPQATIRHGLPSPPADAECFDEYPDNLSMDPICELNFSSLPGPAVDLPVSYDGMSTAGFAAYQSGAMVEADHIHNGTRQAQPRPIRSASERSLSSGHPSTMEDGHFPRDERADKVKARSDPRYDCKPDGAGYYHCPLATEEPCAHKPTKQKCIYAKYLDSHLKPYICKHGGPGNDCENLRFSSNACLFRHEREAHGMHNHGINPYLCLYPGCERARLDNGFPRRWNQRDHMKRVHDWSDADADDLSGDKYGPTESVRRKKAGPSTGVQMKRSSSSQAKAQAATHARGSRNISHGRYQTQVERHVQDYNVIEYLMPIHGASYATYQQPRTSSPFASSYGPLPQ